MKKAYELFSKGEVSYFDFVFTRNEVVKKFLKMHDIPFIDDVAYELTEEQHLMLTLALPTGFYLGEYPDRSECMNEAL